ncbi:MAG: type II toxin-antitoxin system VapC family toxin, partial [Nitrososphaeria archaeon]
LFLYEIASIVVKSMAIGALTPKDCSEALDAIKLLGINIQPVLWEDMIEIVDIAIKTNLTVYDSTYLYLCKKLNAKLVTADEELKNRGEKVADVYFIEDFI